ncbi:MAG: STAS domain-containing protein [Roseovarius sp.]|nr:STAS domain-containing protein [Roseovarius sp.]
MELQSSCRDGTQIVTVHARRIDSAAAIRFKDAMRAVTADGPAHVVLDLGQVAFVDSSGLGAIVAVMKFLGPGRRLDLAGLTPDVDKVFRLTRMDTVFGIFGDADAACGRETG